MTQDYQQDNTGHSSGSHLPEQPQPELWQEQSYLQQPQTQQPQAQHAPAESVQPEHAPAESVQPQPEQLYTAEQPAFAIPMHYAVYPGQAPLHMPAQAEAHTPVQLQTQTLPQTHAAVPAPFEQLQPPATVSAGRAAHSAGGGKKSSAKFRLTMVILSLLLLLGAVAVAVGLNWGMLTDWRDAGLPSDDPAVIATLPFDPIELPTDISNPSEDELSVRVAQKVLPSVVSISGAIEPDGGMGGMGMGMGEVRSAGAGVILQSEGYIVTNNHVIEQMNTITVTAGAQEYPAVLVGADPSTDLAILKIDAEDLPAIELGTSSNLLEGQYVMAVGSPFGHEMSVSAGIISGLGRSNVIATQSTLTAYVDLIQTDAAINPGNSGGALVDREGRLIGINSLINTTSGSSAGVGFAIPVDTVVHVANQLIETGSASHAFLGIGTQTITPEIARAYGFPIDRGVVVNFVAGGSPADVAGIRVGDFIVRIGDHSIASSEDVFSAIRSHRVGDKVQVEIYRSGENDVLNATLASDEFMNMGRE
ncbi:MAG: trypsin-like peptidase domain-containing protein [Coriobacteriia bacterium]|nr:trypsin-like peptidase domain-containing protein [Coriobacteriia bacterium]